MPFTFSHPAIVLPLARLRKQWISLPALIIGSTIPDFEYFIHMRIYSKYSHTLWGLLYFDLPLGLVVYVLFHAIVKRPLLMNLPIFLKARFQELAKHKISQQGIRYWMVVAISLLFGAATHLLWDSFTHKGAYFVERISVLQKEYDFGFFQAKGYKIAQHASTSIGGIAIFFSTLKLPKSIDKDTTGNIKKYWLRIVLFASTILSIRYFIGLPTNQYGNWIVSCISACMLACMANGLLYIWQAKNCEDQ